MVVACGGAQAVVRLGQPEWPRTADEAAVRLGRAVDEGIDLNGWMNWLLAGCAQIGADEEPATARRHPS